MPEIRIPDPIKSACEIRIILLTPEYLNIILFSSLLEIQSQYYYENAK